MKTPKEVVTAFWETVQTNDFVAASRLLAEARVLHYPQSDETFRGREGFIRLNSTYPAQGHWQFTVHQLFAEGPQVVSDVNVTDEVGSARVVTFLTVEGKRIRAQLEFWPEPFDPPEWRLGSA